MVKTAIEPIPPLQVREGERILYVINYGESPFLKGGHRGIFFSYTMV
jgi:hypothetical protein